MAEMPRVVTDRASLVDAAATMLGFVPSESLVVLLMDGQRVAAVWRTNLTDAEETPMMLADQLVSVAQRGSVDGFVAIVVSEAPQTGLWSADAVVESLRLSLPLLDWVVSDGQLTWGCKDAQPVGSPVMNTLSALREYAPMPKPSRADAVAVMLAPLTGKESHWVRTYTKVQEAIAETRDPETVMARLAVLLADLETTPPAAVEISTLAVSCAVELFNLLTSDSVTRAEAPLWCDKLAHAYRWSTPGNKDLLLPLLCLAAWHAGSPLRTECLMIMDANGHPLTPILDILTSGPTHP